MITPLTRRRLDIFKKNKRGYYSLWVFLTLFLVTLCAEFISNDKPLLISYKGELYTPIVRFYPETTFGGDFETEADYTDPYVRQLIDKNGFMIWPLHRYSYDTVDRTSIKPAPSAPCFENPLGTDDQGRDVLARLIYGFRVSLVFGLVLTAISAVIGITAGGIQGYYGGAIDLVFQRFLEIWSGLPVLYLLIILGSFVKPNFWWLMGIMVLFSWISLVPLVRAEFLRARNFDYVRAARALGVGTPAILMRHMLPNAMVSALTYLPFILNGAITTLTSLDFLGFGMPPGSPSLGEMLAQGKNNLYAPWLGVTAFFSLAITLSLLIFIGEAVRDAFDPRRAAI